jgi:hypothetical protein
VQTGTSVGTEGGGPAPSQPTATDLILTPQDPDQAEALTSRTLALSDGGQVAVHHDLRAPLSDPATYEEQSL